MRWKLRALGAFAGLGLSAAFGAAPALAEARPPYGGEVVASLRAEPAALDPVLASTKAEVEVAELLFDTLYQIDERGAPVPHLAAAPPEPLEGDGEEPRFRIEVREGIEFHDGRELGPDDVVRSLERARASASGWLLSPLRAVWADGEAVRVELAVGAEEAMRLLSAPAASITPEGRPPDADEPIGSGPFEFVERSRDRTRLALRAFDRHAAGRPYVDRLELHWYATPDAEARRYETGRSHVSRRGPVAFASNEPVYATREREGGPAALTYIGFGGAEPALTEAPAFRRAVSLAVGRGGLRASGAGQAAQPTALPAPPELRPGAAEAEIMAPRRARAEAQLARIKAASTAARERLEGGGDPLPVLVDESRPEAREVAERVVAALYAVGVAARIEEEPAPRFSRRVRRGEAALYIGELAVSRAGWPIHLAAAFAAGGAEREAKALVRGDRAVGPALLAFQTQLPIVPLLYRGGRVHHRADLRGLDLGAVGRPAYADVFFFGEPEPTAGRGR